MQRTNYSKEEQVSIVNVFDAYIKKVIRNSVSKSLNKQLLRYERECMTELEELEQILSVDPTDEAVEVYVKYYKFMIRDDRLLNALLALSENERAVVLLNIYGELPLYCKEYQDKRYKKNERGIVGKWITKSINQVLKILLLRLMEKSQ